jgi:hypothetical protein
MTNINDDDPKNNKNQKEGERRSGKDRRKVHTMINPDRDRRAWTRRKTKPTKKPKK